MCRKCRFCMRYCRFGRSSQRLRPVQFLDWRRGAAVAKMRPSRSSANPSTQGKTTMSAACSSQGQHRQHRAAPVEIARELGPIFARRANEATDEDRFVADNFAILKTSGLVEAGVPRELGGGGADVDELAAMLRTLAYHCGSTALAFSMHTHQVAIPAWRWTHQKAHAVEPLLKRIAGRAHPAPVERRLGLDRRLRQGREGRRRLSHQRAQDLLLRRAHRRPPDDRRGPREPPASRRWCCISACR